jgi:2',3'-cyclic-nucleotide 2'-phosphodiesterase/3'-nucleotidase
VHAGNETPYFEPYTILKAGKKRIAVLGMITPGIPNWLPKNLWPDMEFRDMVESANEWIPRIKKEEDPDLIVGLFHSGTDASYGGNKEPYMNENAVLLVAEKVPGFDVIFAGHDHRVSIQHVVNSIGDSVLIVDPGSHARYAGQVTITFQADGHRKLAAKNIPMEDFETSEDFNNHFSEDYEKVISYLDDTITWLSEDISGSDALFGPSSIISLIHEVQLDLSGADLSFTAPLSISAALEKGPVLVSDMFKLYRFENMLYTMELIGKEIDGFLEYAAELWFNTMTGPGDQLLRFDPVRPGRLAQPYYNFSTAAGIDYTVDLRQPVGHKITIHGFSDGEAFDDNATYMVAINSYRGNGGGGHLSSGAGIPKEELSKRIAWSTEIDLRYHLMKHLALSDTLHPEVIDNWSLTPEAWTSAAAERDRRYFR